MMSDTSHFTLIEMYDLAADSSSHCFMKRWRSGDLAINASYFAVCIRSEEVEFIRKQ
jgi:hypothetical protein